MGLLDLLKGYKTFKKNPNILILGLDNAGKTTLLKCLTHTTNEEIKTTPTLGINVKSIIYNGFQISLIDIGGQQSIRQYWSAYYQNQEMDALIYVVDAADDMRIAECNEQFKILLNEPALANVPILVYANKSDISGCLEADEILEKLEMNDIEGRDWSLYACSALKGTGVEEGIKWVLEKIAENNK